jgi:hypothetical protein
MKMPRPRALEGVRSGRNAWWKALKRVASGRDYPLLQYGTRTAKQHTLVNMPLP